MRVCARSIVRVCAFSPRMCGRSFVRERGVLSRRAREADLGSDTPRHAGVYAVFETPICVYFRLV